MALKQTLLKTLFLLSLTGIGAGTLTFSGMYLYLNPQLPPVESLRDFRLQVPLRVYSSDGKLVGEFGEKRRTPVKFDDIPQDYIDAILAAEDAEFFSHKGVSLKGLLRAVKELIVTGRKGSGGSTITMQVARNYYLSRKVIYTRKFKEILLALKIESEISKEEILELYVNIIFLGNRAYGIEAASQVYYGKSLDKLSLAQTAMIAGLPKGPSNMNPLVNEKRALQRRDWILGRMLQLGSIDQSQFDAAIAEPRTAKYHHSIPEISASYVAEMARSESIRRLGLAAYTDGYTVYTTIKSDLQSSANRAVVKGITAYDTRHGYRGAEQSLALDILDNQATAENGDAATAIDYSPWQNTLEDIPEYGELKPAAVTKVEAKKIEVLLASGIRQTISWNQGLSTLRPYIDENIRGAKIKTADQAFDVGDVIRLRHDPQTDTLVVSQLPEVQAALVSLNPNNGAILSLVGGFDFGQSRFNRVTQAKRQPGSNFKPFIYAAALEQGMTPATVINDAPIVVNDSLLEDTWRPENDSGKFYGPTRLRTALYRSRNLVSIRVLRQTGIGNTIKSLQRYGFDRKQLPRDLSLSLGSAVITPLQVATGYAVFANGGYKIEPYIIDKIIDNDGRVVYQKFPDTVCVNCDEEKTDEIFELFPLLDKTYADKFDDEQVVLTDAERQQLARNASDQLASKDPLENIPFNLDAFEFPVEIKSLLGVATIEDYPRARQVMEQEVAFLVDSMLKDVIQRGTGYKAKALRRSDIAGKTGTTNGPNDAWFSGYSRNLVTTTWVGFDQFSPMGNAEFGGTAALPIWIDFMREALNGTDESHHSQPPGIVTVKIDPETGYRAKPGDPDAIFEYFRSGQVPQSTSDPAAPYDSVFQDQQVTEEIF
ncbi:MAG: penicillin-binding protein 1A [Cellvibrionaceae bacterium]|nr:penicillin-binding protein 1A [Cellvibrionaceae bacterium]